MKHTKLQVLAVSLFTFAFSVSAQAQFAATSKEDALSIKNTKLAVVVKGEDVKKLKRLASKPEELASYRKALSDANAWLEQAVRKEWDFSKEVSFISEAEAEKIKDSKDAGYSLLEITEVKNYKMGDFYMANKNTSFNTPQAQAYHFSASGNTPSFAIAHAASPNKEIAVAYMPALGLSLGSITSMLQHLENQLEDCVNFGVTSFSDQKKEIAKRAALLKGKTLLLCKDIMSESLEKSNETGDIKELYKYPYKVVSSAELDEYISKEDGNYAYAWVIPAGAVNQGTVLYNYFIMDAKDGRILYVTGKTQIRANGLIAEYHLKDVQSELK